MHRIGGIEKHVDTGHIDYGARQPPGDDRHPRRQGARHRESLPDAGRRASARPGGRLAVVGWGSTFGPIHQAVRRARRDGQDVSHIHVRHIWPLPTNLGDLAHGLRPDHRAGDEHRPAQDACCAISSWSTPARSTRSPASRSRSPRSRRRSTRRLTASPATMDAEAATPVPAADHADRGGRGDRLFHRQAVESLMTEIGQAHREGLRHRPGGALVPRLRRLRDAEGGAADDAGARRRSREDGVRLRHRLLVALPLLHGDLRLPHHPRPRAGGCHGREAGQSRARRLGRHRRRRCAVDRRQSHDAHAAPQPRLPDPAVQQRDLRPDEGPVFAHVAASARVRPRRPFGSVDRPVRPCAFALGSRRRASSPARSTCTRICPTC